MELLLAFLWASEHGGLTETQLSDVEENPTLNQLIRNAKAKLHDGPTGANPPGDRGKDARAAEAWAVSSQSIIQQELNRMH